MDNVSMETPNFGETVLSKETADELKKIEAEAQAAIAKSTDDSEPDKIIAAAEQKKKQVVSHPKQKIVAQDTSTKIPALRLAISGTYAGSDSKPHEYSFEDILVPAVPNLISYMKQIAYQALKKDGAGVRFEDIITHYVDDEQEATMEPTFIGKSVLELTEEEVLHAKMRYGLKPVDITNGVRAARIDLYRAVCIFTGREAPDQSDTQIRKWPIIKLA